MPRIPAPEPVEGDPFGLHDPVTMNDLCRIEEALADGSVSSAEADRLRAIHDGEMAPMREAMKSFAGAFSGFKLDPKLMAGVSGAIGSSVAQFPDLADKIGLESDLAKRVGVTIGDACGDVIKNLGSGLANTALKDKFTPDLSAFFTRQGLTAMSAAQIRVPEIDPEIFVDTRPARMEELAERQITTLADVCASLHDVAAVIEESEAQAEKRHNEAMRSSRHQFRVLVVVTMLVGLLAIAATVAASAIG